MEAFSRASASRTVAAQGWSQLCHTLSAILLPALAHPATLGDDTSATLALQRGCYYSTLAQFYTSLSNAQRCPSLPGLALPAAPTLGLAYCAALSPATGGSIASSVDPVWSPALDTVGSGGWASSPSWAGNASLYLAVLPEDKIGDGLAPVSELGFGVWARVLNLSWGCLSSSRGSGVLPLQRGIRVKGTAVATPTCQLVRGGSRKGLFPEQVPCTARLFPSFRLNMFGFSNELRGSLHGLAPYGLD